MTDEMALAVLPDLTNLWYNWPRHISLFCPRWTDLLEEVSMPTRCVELPARVSQAEVEALRGDLAPYGTVDELPSASYDP
jgi:hypothetical protein